MLVSAIVMCNKGPWINQTFHICLLSLLSLPIFHLKMATVCQQATERQAFAVSAIQTVINVCWKKVQHFFLFWMFEMLKLWTFEVPDVLNFCSFTGRCDFKVSDHLGCCSTTMNCLWYWFADWRLACVFLTTRECKTYSIRKLLMSRTKA